jgi:two-component system chemotaxis response regulator CheY
LSTVLNGMRILVVEDLESIRELVSRLLLGLGCKQVHTAADTRSAKHKIDRLGFDAVLLDYDLAGENGLDLLRRLRRDTWHFNREVPVIILTGNNEADTIRDSVALGANAFLVKPVMPDRLGQRILDVTAKTGWRRPPDRGTDPDPATKREDVEPEEDTHWL